MCLPIRAFGGHLLWRIGSKNTNMVEDLEYLIPVRFGEIPYSGCREEVENVSTNKNSWWPSLDLLTDWVKNTNLIRGLKYLLPIKFCEIQCRSCCREVDNVSDDQNSWRPPCLTDRKRSNMVEDHEYVLPVRFGEIPAVVKVMLVM